MLQEDEPRIIHLHGHWEEPESVVLGIGSYEQVMQAGAPQEIQQALTVFMKLVFVGCGDPFLWMTAVDTDEVARRCVEDDRPALRALLPDPPRAEELLHETSAFREEWGTHIEELGNPDATVEESAW